MLIWRKLSSAKWEDAWMERLNFIDPQRVVVTSFAGGRTVRIEAYVGKKEAGLLVKRFGGQVRKVSHSLTLPAGAPHAPLRIRGRLVVVRSEKEGTPFGSQALVIPAAMAFGTGDHATTATCLRLLCDTAAALPMPWDLLDLGTGTGILAIAAKQLGARQADAFDFDPACVRATRENALLNHVDLRSIRRVDVTGWQPTRRYEVITANLYSQLLIAAAPQMARAIRPGGTLILSGVLREQEAETSAAFAEKFALEKVIRRGKWVAFLATARDQKIR